jgi:hypothetical protein
MPVTGFGPTAVGDGVEQAWTVHRKVKGFKAVGPEVKFTAVSGSRIGIQQIALRLRHSVPEQTIALGSVTL